MSGSLAVAGLKGSVASKSIVGGIVLPCFIGGVLKARPRQLHRSVGMDENLGMGQVRRH
jgi:hypothetical protein